MLLVISRWNIENVVEDSIQKGQGYSNGDTLVWWYHNQAAASIHRQRGGESK